MGHALSSALRMCIGRRRRRNVLNYCIALIYIAAALARTSRRTRRPSGHCWLARQLHSVSPMQLSSALDTSPPPLTSYQARPAAVLSTLLVDILTEFRDAIDNLLLLLLCVCCVPEL